MLYLWPFNDLPSLFFIKSGSASLTIILFRITLWFIGMTCITIRPSPMTAITRWLSDTIATLHHLQLGGFRGNVIWRLNARMETAYIGYHIDGLAQYCSNFNALAMELLQSCAKPYVLAQDSINFSPLATELLQSCAKPSIYSKGIYCAVSMSRLYKMAHYRYFIFWCSIISR